MVQAKQTPGAKYKVNESLILKRIKGPKYLQKDNRNKSFSRVIKIAPGLYEDIQAFLKTQTPN